MKRRDFFRQGVLAGMGLALTSPLTARQAYRQTGAGRKTKPAAKNIIFLVSDGMSSGTLTMADMLCERKYGRSSNWIKLYKDKKVSRALMDMRSRDSLVTDSAAAASSWGCGVRVNNNTLNMGPEGERYKPILQKFKDAGKAVGCVTTVPITHATPAGFCVSTPSRANQAKIAGLYLDLHFDVMMGGGLEYFIRRDDGINMFNRFRDNGYQVVSNMAEMNRAVSGKPLLGVFHDGGLPYAIDHENDLHWRSTIPSLAEMTARAIDLMKDHAGGFVMQVEGGKVDWAAHGNDTAGLLYDQLAFDDAIKVAVDFADTRTDTLVIITTDHGNANPGLFYGRHADRNFDTVQEITRSNDLLLRSIERSDSPGTIVDKIRKTQGIKITRDEASQIAEVYQGLRDKDLSNYAKLPFKLLADIQSHYTSVQWAGTHHTSDYVELAMYGAGRDQLGPFMNNTDLHFFMLDITGTEG